MVGQGITSRKFAKGKLNGNYRHGQSKTQLYKLWKSIKQRCGKGEYENIQLCDEWQSPSEFIRWATQNGYNNHLQIDRIDTLGGYAPKNCRFVTAKENSNNRRNSWEVEINNKWVSVSEYARATGKTPNTIRVYIKKGLLKGRKKYPNCSQTAPKNLKYKGE